MTPAVAVLTRGLTYTAVGGSHSRGASGSRRPWRL
jgi:hypothetical protein